MKHSLLLLGVIAALAIGAPAYSQYIYLDVLSAGVGDGVCNSSDVLTSTTTEVDVYVNTNHDAAGGTSVCVNPAQPLDLFSYDLIVGSGGAGSVTFNSYTHNSSLAGAWAVLNPFTTSGG